jgi:teichuronic acid biosynthesis glycosyltransferase TuaC
MKKGLLYITSIFPNPREMSRGPYNREEVSTLSEFFDITVIAPVPWHSTLFRPSFARRWRLDNVEVRHPTLFYPSGCLHTLHGYFYYRSVIKEVRDALAQGRFSCLMGTWLYPDSWAVMKIARAFNLPYYVKVHGTDVNRLARYSRLIAPSLTAVDGANGVFCVSQHLKKTLCSYGADPKKLHVVLNGIRPDVFYRRERLEARKALGVAPEERAILYVGNMKSSKGVWELLDAFAELSRDQAVATRLYLIGGGPLAQKLEQYALRKRFNGAVSFLGVKTSHEVALWMNAASVLCLPSYTEGMPNVVLEALSCGTPVVASAVGGIQELAAMEPAITCVPPRNAPALRDVLAATIRHEERVDTALQLQSWREHAMTLSSIMAV